MSSFLKNVFGNTVANEVLELKTPLPPVDREAEFKKALAEPARVVPVARITYDLIRQTIVNVRESKTLGLGKWSKDDHLAEALFCLVKMYEPNSTLTYERIMQAIVFVKSNELMGAGKWTKEDHLAEYLYALVRLSETNSTAAQTPLPEELTVLGNGVIAPHTINSVRGKGSASQATLPL